MSANFYITGRAAPGTTPEQRELLVGPGMTAEQLIAGLGAFAQGTPLDVTSFKINPVMALAGGQLIYNSELRTLHYPSSGNTSELTRIEDGLFGTLVGSPDKVFSRRDLQEKVWGDGTGDAHIVNVHLSHTRRKLGSVRDHLHTVRGKGFVWLTEVRN